MASAEAGAGCPCECVREGAPARRRAPPKRLREGEQADSKAVGFARGLGERIPRLKARDDIYKKTRFSGEVSCQILRTKYPNSDIFIRGIRHDSASH